MKKTLTLLLSAALALGCESGAKETIDQINVIPYPNKVELGKGSFKAAGASFNCEEGLSQASLEQIRELAASLTLVSGKTSSVASPSGLAASAREGSLKGFVFLKDAALEEGAYTLEINKKACIVKASGFPGFLHSLQTLKQLLGPAVFSKEPLPKEKFRLPGLRIEDAPRFAYRGLHLDCARHFFSVEEVKKYLDIMALYKMNRFHWHLTDDQGWRLEIKKYPKLTQIGAYRNGTVIKKDWDSNDGIRYGGYYTQEQVKDIVAYAAALDITVIPEIDLPGHMMGALAAYPELGCTGGPYEVWTRWGVSEQVLCPGKEGMFTFLNDVFDEVLALFPSEYIHIGGDECPKTEWEKCPDCQARIRKLGLKDDEKHSAEAYLQNYVTARVQDMLNAKGRKIIGWDEVLEGKLAEGATVMSWRGVDGGVKAAGLGFDVIMTPNTFMYFDYYQSKEQDKEPFGIGGFLPLEQVYGYEPFEGLDEASQKHILGVQANLWTEYIATPEHLEYMLLPRMFALSEVQWCVPSNKDYGRFTKAVKDEAFPILDALGYNYRKF